MLFGTSCCTFLFSHSLCQPPLFSSVDLFFHLEGPQTMGPLRCKPGHRAFCYGKQVIVLDPSQVWQWRNLRARPHCPDDCSIEQRMLPLKDSNGNIVRARLPHMLPVQMKPVTKARIMKRLTFSQKLEARRVRFNLQNGLCVGPIMSPAQLECVLEKNTLNNPYVDESGSGSDD